MAANRAHLVAELRVEQARVAEVERVLRAALRDVTVDLRRGRGSARPSDQVTESQLKAQKAALERRLSNGFKDIEEILATGHQDAARAASDVVSDAEGSLFRKLGIMDDKAIAALKTSEGQRAAAGVEAAIRRVSGQTYKPLSARVYGSQQIATGYVNDVVNRGLAQGWNWQRLAREVKGSIDPNTPGGASYAAKRLARTEINNAYHASTIARAKATGIVEYMDWNLSSSHPENDECDQYAKDSPFELDKIPEKPHPNCYCFLTEGLPDEDQFLENLFAGKYDPEGGFGDDEDSPTAEALAEVRSQGVGRVPLKKIDMSAKGDVTAIKESHRLYEARQAAHAWDKDPLGIQNLAATFEATGLDKAVPTLVDKAATRGLTPIYRVVNGTGTPSSKQIQQQFLTGDHYAGRGYYGNGSYFAQDYEGSKHYAEGPDSSMIEMFIDKDAKIVDYDEAYAGLKKQSTALKRLVKQGKLTEDEMYSFGNDVSNWAIANGYDGIHVANNGYTVILNRSALVYTDGVYV